jgi:hypothetical protein
MTTVVRPARSRIRAVGTLGCVLGVFDAPPGRAIGTHVNLFIGHSQTITGDNWRRMLTNCGVPGEQEARA